MYRDSNGGASTKMPNGYPDHNNSPNSSQISADGSGGHHSSMESGPTLISRTQKQHTTQQVTTTTKTIREIQYIGPDGQPLEYVPTTTSSGGYPQLENRSGSSAGPQGPPGAYLQQQPPGYANYAEYPHRPPTPPSPSDRSSSPPPQHREPGKTFTTAKALRLRINTGTSPRGLSRVMNVL